MKNKNNKKNGLWLFILIFIAASCQNGNDLSDAYGNFEATTVFISSDVSGKLLYLDIEEGEKPDSGKLVAIVDTLPYFFSKNEIEAQQLAVYSKLQNLDAQTETLKEQRKSLKVEIQRAENLFNDGAATSQTVDDLNGRLNVLNSRIRSIPVQKQSVKSEAAVLDQKMLQVKDKLDRCYIKNQVTGTVLEKYVELHEMVVAGKPMYKIADLSFMELRVYIDAVMLSEIKLGNEVRVLFDKNTKENRELHGKVSWISSQAEFTPKIIQTKEERVKLVYAVKIRVKNDGYLKIGMPGEAVFGSVKDER